VFLDLQKYKNFKAFLLSNIKEELFSAKPSLDFSSVVRSKGQRWGRNMKYCKKNTYILVHIMCEYNRYRLDDNVNLPGYAVLYNVSIDRLCVYIVLSKILTMETVIHLKHIYSLKE